MQQGKRECPICGSRRLAETREVSGKQSIDHQPLRLATCADCAALFQPSVPADATLAAWYAYMGENPRNQRMSPLLRRRHGRILRMFERFRKGGRLLEIGCGGGLFLRSAAESGWDAFGTEISPTCCEALRPRLAHRLHQGDLMTAPFESGWFDVVLMIEVIEHLPTPFPYLRAAYSLLRPGGCLLLTTPHWGGLSSRIFGDRWRVVADEHLSYFTIPALRTVLARAGFSNVKVATTSLDLAGPLRRWLSRTSSRSPSLEPRNGPAGGSQELRAVLYDQLIECGNYGLASLRMGDSLKAFAVRN